MAELELIIHSDFKKVKTLLKNEQNEIILAQRISDSKNVILKQSVFIGENISGVSRTAHEYEILKSIDHKGIPKVFDIIYDGKMVTLVQEYIAGTDLRDLILNRKTDYPLVLDISIQLAEILQFIHDNQIIHKDISPRNLILDESGTLKLLDFGISSDILSETSDVLNVGQIEGNLRYISPEQTGRTSHAVTKSSDFYSTGILIYEMLTGKPPFDSADPLEVIHFHLSRNPVSLKNILPDIPEGLTQIVSKLLEKNPDDRYHNASGLKADLITVSEHLNSKKPLSGFKAGLKDFSDQYKQSQKLYGREPEIAELLDIYRNLNKIQSMLVLVAGYSGVGKSALIRHIKFPIIQNKGTFISGKFDQFKKDIPYYAFIEAFHEFIKNLLSEPEETIAAWRNRFVQVLGENAGLITEVIPLLTKIIGIQSPVPKLQPAEQENRFHMVLNDFIYAFSTADSPLVIFLDDLQWADLTSLSLLKRILENPRETSVMLLGAYRDNEVSKGHPLAITIKQIKESNKPVKEIHLKPLSEETTCAITRDSFGMSDVQATELGKHVFQKTQGNPFFIHSLLKSLFDKKLVKKEKTSWHWNQNEIESLSYTDNVIDLMTARIQDLQSSTQETLKIGAVLGNTFRLKDLANIIEKSKNEVYLNLLPAVKEGYLISTDNKYRTIALSFFDREKELNPDEKQIRFTFSHDKVQQAAYNLNTKEELAPLHLKIGNLLLKNSNENQLQDEIFEMVNHFALSYELIKNKEDKKQIAELFYTAGRKAKDSTSYNVGVSFLEIAQNLLGENSWAENYTLTYNILITLGECEYLNDNAAKAEFHLKEVLSKSKTRFEKLQVYYLHSSLYLKMGNTSESLRLGLEAARMYDIRFPSNKIAIQVSAMLTMLKYLILFSTKYKNPESVFNLNDCTDEEMVALNKFLIDLATSAYQQDQNLMMLVIFKIISFYLKHGFSDASGWGFSGFSVVVLSVLKLQKRGFDLWDITTKLHQRTNSPLIKWRLNYTVLCFQNHWRLPFRDGYNSINETIKACVLNGDQIFTGYTVSLLIRTKLMAGDNLKEILENAEDHYALVKNTRGGFDFYIGFLQTAKSLRGLTGNNSWNDETFNGDDFQNYLVREGNKTKLAFFLASKVYHLFMLEKYREALIESEVLTGYSDNFPGDICEVINAFFTSMSVAAVYPELNATEKKKYLKKFKKHISELKLWATGCNANYGAFYRLALAEFLVLNQQAEKGLNHYISAVQLASEHRILNVEAIANERAGILCKTIKLEKQGNMYLAEAWKAYKKWGAVTKCKNLEIQYPEIQNHDFDIADKVALQNPFATTFSTTSAFDLASVVKASQTIASQVKYSDVLKNLLHITIENAGAEKGCLLLYKDNKLCVEAIGVSGNDDIEILPSIPFEESSLVPITVINYCRRTDEIVAVHNAVKEEKFSADPYILTHKTQSVLCLPITAIGNSKGFLYLENNLLQGVFDRDRTELLQMLSGQIGISIENSILYENLEEKVKERTLEIEKTLAELKATQTQLIQSEKMASLGELTAGIAHEIQNPLNFVNNFSDLNSELIDEVNEELESGNLSEAKSILSDIKDNGQKINHHGKRAADIVKGMLQHSRTGTAQKELTDINALCDEYLRLSYHGLRAKDKSFNAGFKMEADETLPKIEVVPQDIGRVLLNLINNAFYVVNDKVKQNIEGYKPEVVVSTSSSPLPTGQAGFGEGGLRGVKISVKDNGNGIPESIKDKIFQPFFTTKPTGLGTGLGLSLSYDIVKAHGGEIKVESVEGKGTVFTIQIPVH